MSLYKTLNVSLLTVRKCQKSPENSYNVKIDDIATLLKMVQTCQRTVGFSHTLGISHHHHDKRGHRFKIKD